MYIDVNAVKDSKLNTDKAFTVNDNGVTDVLKPYLNIIGITDTKNKAQLLHYNAVRLDMLQTLQEAEAKMEGD